MGQIRLLLFARNDIYPAISKVERGSQATGVAGVATNKGGVAIALQVNQPSCLPGSSHSTDDRCHLCSCPRVMAQCVGVAQTLPVCRHTVHTAVPQHPKHSRHSQPWHCGMFNLPLA